MGKLSRTKGHSFEREIARLLKCVFPNARRHLEYHQRDANGIDLIETGPYKIQCKRGRKYASLSKIKEIQAFEELGDVPVLVTKGDNEPILVALPIDEFIYLLKIAKGNSEI